jgi:hypothetical protein
VISIESLLEQQADSDAVKFYNKQTKYDQRIIVNAYECFLSSGIDRMGQVSAFELAVAMAMWARDVKMKQLIEDKVKPAKHNGAFELAEKEFGYEGRRVSRAVYRIQKTNQPQGGTGGTNNRGSEKQK